MSFREATGKMRFTLTNDYLFRATLQKSGKALKGLICAVLDREPEEVRSVEITNPIELGESMEAKDFLLDIRVLLDNDTIMNMEMQVLNMGNWPERSLVYLCRSFDSLNRGQDYLMIRSVIQVCFLDFTLFRDYPEFFSTYMFVNIRNHIIYSDKLKLFVIDLTQIDEATEEERSRGMEHWARLFKATTWEEIKMLAEKNEFLEEAAETAYRLSAEEKIRLQCQAREDYYRTQNTIKAVMEQQVQKIVEQGTKITEQNAKITEQGATIAEQGAKITEQNAEITRLLEKLAGYEKKNATEADSSEAPLNF